MRRALYLEKDADLQARETAAQFGDAQRRIAADVFKRHRLLQPVAGDIGLHRVDHVLNRLAVRLTVAVVAEAIDGIAHDQRRFGGVEDDDRLAARRAADIDDRLACRLGELVDIRARARPRTLRPDPPDDPALLYLLHHVPPLAQRARPPDRK